MNSKEFDRYSYYLKSVQSPDSDVQFICDTYRELRKKRAVTFREDFCGTFMLSCEWVKLHKSHQSIGMDIDPEPITYGRTHYFTKLNLDQQKRVKIIEKNVLAPRAPKADIIGAFNFSYYCFKERKMMFEYFKAVHRSLNKDGIFMVDMFGGPLCQHENEENTRHKDFVYYWDQESYDPVTNQAVFHIHFKRKGEKKRERVFSYDWRMWTIPEIRELMSEAGFSKTHVYWEGTSRNGNGNGVFTSVEKGEECEAWIAYVVGEV